MRKLIVIVGILAIVAGIVNAWRVDLVVQPTRLKVSTVGTIEIVSTGMEPTNDPNMVRVVVTLKVQ